MSNPHTLIFFDLAPNDPAAAGRFYAVVSGWEDDVRLDSLHHRQAPGGTFRDGFTSAFADPRRAQIVLWRRGGQGAQTSVGVTKK